MCRRHMSGRCLPMWEQTWGPDISPLRRLLVHYTHEMLEALRQEGDPLADGVIAELEATEQLAAVNRVLSHLTTNDQAIPAGLPPALERYLIATDQPPTWID